MPVSILEVDTRCVSALAQLGRLLGSIRESWACARPRHIGGTSIDLCRCLGLVSVGSVEDYLSVTPYTILANR